MLAALLMRALDKNGAIYLPYGFEGSWTEDEKAVVSAAIDPHVPARVDSSFNTWVFTKVYDGFFIFGRATFEFGGRESAESAQDVAAKVAAFYARRSG